MSIYQIQVGLSCTPMANLNLYQPSNVHSIFASLFNGNYLINESIDTSSYGIEIYSSYRDINHPRSLYN